MPKNQETLRNRLNELFSGSDIPEAADEKPEAQPMTPSPAAIQPDRTTSAAGDRDQLVQVQNQLFPPAFQPAEAPSIAQERELQCLIDILQKIDERPKLNDFLEWICERIPSAMQHPESCVVAITLRENVFGNEVAVHLARKIVRGIRVGDQFVGHLHIAYKKEVYFLGKRAFIGAVVGCLAGYFERHRLLYRLHTVMQQPPKVDMPRESGNPPQVETKAVTATAPATDNSVPIIVDGRPVGKLGLKNNAADEPASPEELALMAEVGARVSQALSRLKQAQPIEPGHPAGLDQH